MILHFSSHFFLMLKQITKREDSYQKAKDGYKTWADERKRVIRDLSVLRDQIQELSINLASNSAAHGFLGVSGGAVSMLGVLMMPFSIGASVIFTVAGAGIGVYSGVEGYSIGERLKRKIQKKSEEVISILKDHEKSGERLRKLLELYEKDLADIVSLTTEYEKQYRNNSTVPDMENGARAAGVCAKVFQPSTISRVNTVFISTCTAKNVHLLKVGKQLKAVQQIQQSQAVVRISEVSTGVLVPLAVLGFVVDAGTIVFSLNKLSNLNKGQLSEEAQKIQECVYELLNEKRLLRSFFYKET